MYKQLYLNLFNEQFVDMVREGDEDMFPIIYFVAIIQNGAMIWQDNCIYKTENGARRRRKKLQSEHSQELTVLYADEFKQAIGGKK